MGAIRMEIADKLKTFLTASCLLEHYVMCLYNYVHEHASGTRMRDFVNCIHATNGLQTFLRRSHFQTLMKCCDIKRF